MRSEQETNRAVERYGDMIRRLCLVHLKNETDAQNIYQTVFLKYFTSEVVFENEEHEKAWLIRVCLNACRDWLRDVFRRRTVNLDALYDQGTEMPQDNQEVLQAVLTLPAKEREIVYLHYYEGYTAPQIGKILGKNPNTVHTCLTRAREKLRKKLGGEQIG